MAELIDRQKAVDALQKLIDARTCSTCSRSRILEAQAFRYAQAIVRQLPAETVTADPQEAPKKTTRRTAKKAAE